MSGAAEAGLLALFHAGVAGQEMLLAKLVRRVAVVPYRIAESGTMPEAL